MTNFAPIATMTANIFATTSIYMPYMSVQIMLVEMLPKYILVYDFVLSKFAALLVAFSIIVTLHDHTCWQSITFDCTLGMHN